MAQDPALKILIMGNARVNFLLNVFSGFRRLTSVALGCGFCLIISACSITDSVSFEDAEGQIPASLFDDIKHKRVETPTIVDQLGEPVLIEKMGEEYSVMTYRFSRLQTRNMRVFYVLHAGGREQDVAYFHIAYKGQDIKKSWVDDNLHVQKRHKLIQKMEVEPKQKKKSGLSWRLPFFSKKKDKEESSMPSASEMPSAESPQVNSRESATQPHLETPNAELENVDREAKMGDEEMQVDLNL